MSCKKLMRIATKIAYWGQALAYLEAFDGTHGGPNPCVKTFLKVQSTTVPQLLKSTYIRTVLP